MEVAAEKLLYLPSIVYSVRNIWGFAGVYVQFDYTVTMLSRKEIFFTSEDIFRNPEMVCCPQR
jgi:hypothetical protein